LVSEQINFRYEIEEGTTVRLGFRIRKPGKLTKGFMHFPDGCVSAVLVRMLISSKHAGGIRQVCPVGQNFIALNDSEWEFTLDEWVVKEDVILVDMENQGQEPHQISVIITRWSDVPTDSELAAKEVIDKLKRSRTQ